MTGQFSVLRIWKIHSTKLVSWWIRTFVSFGIQAKEYCLLISGTCVSDFKPLTKRKSQNSSQEKSCLKVLCENFLEKSGLNERFDDNKVVILRISELVVFFVCDCFWRRSSPTMIYRIMSVFSIAVAWRIICIYSCRKLTFADIWFRSKTFMIDYCTGDRPPIIQRYHMIRGLFFPES